MVNRHRNVLHVQHRSLDLLVVTTLGGDVVCVTLGSQRGFKKMLEAVVMMVE